MLLREDWQKLRYMLLRLLQLGCLAQDELQNRHHISHMILWPNELHADAPSRRILTSPLVSKETKHAGFFATGKLATE